MPPKRLVVSVEPDTRSALVRFEEGKEAMVAVDGLHGKKFHHLREPIQAKLSDRELEPPIDSRWRGRWLNWERRIS